MGSQKANDYRLDPSVFKVALHSETGRFEDKWSYCTGQCRTNPLSTFSESRYKDSHHFCYSKYPVPENTFFPLPRELKVIMGLRGQSCDQACQDKGMKCESKHFEKVNFCEIMAEHTGFRCRFCRIGNKGLMGPAVQYLPGVEHFDGNCHQNKQLESFSCGNSVIETFNRVCPCM